MASRPDPTLIEISQRIADGEEIPWDALFQSRPELARPLAHLRRLQSLAEICRSTDRWNDSGSAASHATGSRSGSSPEAGSVEEPLRSWGPLTLLEKIGEGSFGEVYRALDRVLQRHVALKLRRPMGESELSSHRRHLEEARLLARVQHPNVLTIHGIEVHEGRSGMWTDFIDGETLEEVIAPAVRGEAPGLSAAELARIGTVLAQALGAVHAAGLIHGDIKASNVMRRRDGRLVLMDFGAGRSLESIRAGTRMGVAGAGGTPASMAPEMLRGEPPSVATDLYAVGVLLYRLATGRHPYQAHTLADLITKVETETPIASSELRPDLPRALTTVVDGLMSVNATDRPKSATEVELALAIAFDVPATSEVDDSLAGRWPVPTHPLLGRRNELLGLLRAFQQARIVTLHGPGGMGKTRLGIECARRMSRVFLESGVWLDLTGLPAGSGIENLAQELLRRLESRPTPGESLVSAAARLLGKGAGLLVVDNAEHVMEGCRELVLALHDSCPDLRILVTSRVPLGVKGEVLFPLGALSFPPRENLSTASVLEFDSVRLFLDRAQRQRPDLHLTNENAAAIASICRSLEGLPLAVELAAARVRSLGIAELALRMEEDHALVLRKQSASVDSHHETLHACIEWSYRLLSAESRRLLERASVFRGGWTLQAAERICGESNEERRIEPGDDAGDSRAVAGILDHLEDLVDRSVVLFEPSPPEIESSPDRYRMLEAVRTFASEQAASNADSMQLRARHLRYFRELAERAETHFLGPREQIWMARLRQDHQNFEAALDFVTPDRASTEDAIRMAAALGRYWITVGLARHGLRRCEEILRRPASSDATRYRASLLGWVGNLRESLGDLRGAISAHEDNLRISEELGNRRGVAVALSNITNSELALGNPARGRELAARSCEIMEALGDKRGTAYSLNTMARAEQAMDAHESAIRLLERSLAIQRELGDGLGAALALQNMAVSLLAQERFAEAEPRVMQALAIRRVHDFRPGIASSLSLLATLFLVRGQFDDAERCVRECLMVRRELQLTQGVLEVMDKFAILAVRRGHLERASVILGMIEGLRERQGIPWPRVNETKMRAIAGEAQAGLGARRYELENECGRVMSMDQACAYLLQTSPSS